MRALNSKHSRNRSGPIRSYLSGARDAVRIQAPAPRNNGGHVKRYIFFIALLSASACSAVVQNEGSSPAASPVLEERRAFVAVARSRQFDFVSKVNGLAYRVMVSTPATWDPPKAYPVLYVLDGNENFGTASEIVSRHNRLGVSVPGIIVGIGYPTEDPGEFNRRRWLDLTISPSKDPKEAGMFGRADAFIRVLEEEVRPLVAANFRLDPARQGIWGYSYGGLTVLRIMFRNPGAYSTYIAASPSIWWGEREILADEESFSKRARAGEVRLRLLITSASEEQYRGNDAARATADRARMVDNATELAQRLGQLNPENLVVARAVFDGEVHASVPPAALSRGVRFAFAR